MSAFILIVLLAVFSIYSFNYMNQKRKDRLRNRRERFK